MYWRDVIPSFGGLGRAIGSGFDIVVSLLTDYFGIRLAWLSWRMVKLGRRRISWSTTPK